MENGCSRARVAEVESGWSIELAPWLPGKFQIQNSLNAVAAARYLQKRGYRISDEAIAQGIVEAVWPGRLEKLQSEPDVYLDGAHNPSAARELAAFLEQNLAGRKIWLVFGALRDKAVDEIAGRAISACRRSDFHAAAHHARHFRSPACGNHCSPRRRISRSSLSRKQHSNTRWTGPLPHDAVIVAGSLYLVGQLRHYWKNRVQVAAR